MSGERGKCDRKPHPSLNAIAPFDRTASIPGDIVYLGFEGKGAPVGESDSEWQIYQKLLIV